MEFNPKTSAGAVGGNFGVRATPLARHAGKPLEDAPNVFKTLLWDYSLHTWSFPHMGGIIS